MVEITISLLVFEGSLLILPPDGIDSEGRKLSLALSVAGDGHNNLYELVRT
jgi:hypothetical protein